MNYKDTITSIAGDLDSLVGAMQKKGIRIPEARCSITAEKITVMLLVGRPGGRAYDHQYHCFTADDFDLTGALDKARKWITDQPTKDEAALADYLALIAMAVDHAKEHNLEQPLINPLQELAKKLAHNILPRQSA